MATRTVNKVILIGHLGQDPEMRYTPTGVATATISVATNRRKQQPNGEWGDETDWHRIICWEARAEFAGTYLKKGRKVYVEGRLQTRRYEDNAGNPRTITEIVAQEVIALDRADDNAQGEDDWGDGPTKQRDDAPRSRHRRDVEANKETFASEEFDDVPF